MSLQSDNQLIAEFMGTTKLPYGWTAVEGRLYAYNDKYYPSQLKYHCNWNWIMPVVEKIERMGYDFNINNSHVIVCNSENGYEYDDMADSKIEIVRLAVVEFIKRHNQNNINHETN
jgi:hypothetical protein